MKNLKSILEAAVAGVVLTAASGLVQSTPGQLIGASWYGWPWTWVRKLVLAPQYNPWVIDWWGSPGFGYGFIGDFIFWFIVALIIGYIIYMVMGKKSGSNPPAKKQKK